MATLCPLSVGSGAAPALRRSSSSRSRRAAAASALPSACEESFSSPARLLGCALSAAALCASLLSATPALAAKPRATEAVPSVAATLTGSVRGTVGIAESTTARGRRFIQVTVSIDGLAPGSEHGLNIHTKGEVSCSDATASCTGESFNPEGLPHGKPDALKKFGASASHYAGEGSRYWRHVGDLRNVTADASGSVRVSFEDPVVQLSGPLSVVGRSIVVHDKADDGVTEPTGVLAYGTLQIVN